jgi:hypothetical protein
VTWPPASALGGGGQATTPTDLAFGKSRIEAYPSLWWMNRLPERPHLML